MSQQNMKCRVSELGTRHQQQKQSRHWTTAIQAELALDTMCLSHGLNQ